MQLVEYANSLNDSGSVAKILGRAMQIKQQLIYGDLGSAKVRFEDKFKQKFIMGASDKYFYAPNQVTVPTHTLLVIYQCSCRSVHPERKCATRLKSI